MALDPQAIAENVAAALEYPEGMEKSIAKLKTMIETMIEDMADTAEWGMKWGTIIIPDTPGDEVSVTFGTAYPNDSYVISIAIRNTVDTPVDLGGQIIAKSASGFTIGFAVSVVNMNNTLEWMTKAIGPA